MSIDSFCHITPKEALQSYVRTQLPQLLRWIQVNVPPEDAYFVDDDARMKYMDKYRIDIEVVSFAPPIWDTLSEPEVKPVVRIANDSLAQVVNKHRTRMIGIASIPILSEDHIDEVDRAIQDLGMKGVTIFSNVRGRPLDAPEFIPFYAKMAKYDLPIFIHPTSWKYYDWINDYRLVAIFGWPFDTSLAVGRLVFGGILDRFPNLKIVVHHVGAMVPFFNERIRGFYDEAIMHGHVYGSQFFPFAKTMKKHPMEYFRMLYADTVANGSLAALKCGYDFFGADHIVYATDYPFGPEKGERWTKEITENVHDLDVSEEDRKKILEGNARRILKL